MICLSTTGSVVHLREKASITESDVIEEMQTSVGLPSETIAGTPSSAVSLSTSNSELKFLRVLQTLYSLCSEFSHEESNATEVNAFEFSTLMQSLDLEPLWKELETCLRVVSVLEGVAHHDEMEENTGDGDGEGEPESDDPLKEKSGKKLQNSVAGLISRFLPAVEAFFIVNATQTVEEHDASTEHAENVQPDQNNRLVQFASKNKVLLNALLRSNPLLLEKGLKSMVKIPRCRPFLDFDVKRQWFKVSIPVTVSTHVVVRKLIQYLNQIDSSAAPKATSEPPAWLSSTQSETQVCF